MTIPQGVAELDADLRSSTRTWPRAHARAPEPDAELHRDLAEPAYTSTVPRLAQFSQRQPAMRMAQQYASCGAGTVPIPEVALQGL